MVYYDPHITGMCLSPEKKKKKKKKKKKTNQKKEAKPTTPDKGE